MLGQLEPEQIEQLLITETIGRIGCHADGRTYVVPVTFAYDGERVIIHSAEGQKLKIMRANPEVCFEVEHVENLGNWQTVIAWGQFEELEDAEALGAMNLLVEKIRPQMASETMQPTRDPTSRTAYRPVLYGIRLLEKTGRFESR
jgi:nitroimidazol reductase NimA-like FMN-containing flavoprotein (pyridoxamine 5'-phosphate oxidase superfamily)